jgi:hypothetical protein
MGCGLWAALNPKHMKLDPGQKFAEGRIRYEFLRTSRTGLNLDSYVVSMANSQARLMLYVATVINPIVLLHQLRFLGVCGRLRT